MLCICFELSRVFHQGVTIPPCTLGKIFFAPLQVWDSPHKVIGPPGPKYGGRWKKHPPKKGASFFSPFSIISKRSAGPHAMTTTVQATFNSFIYLAGRIQGGLQLIGRTLKVGIFSQGRGVEMIYRQQVCSAFLNCSRQCLGNKI